MCAALKAGTQGTAEVVDSLLRAAADEVIINNYGTKAVDVIGDEVEEEERMVEDVERVHKLLVNAPADRAWRRRGYLARCRAYSDRVQREQMIDGTHPTDTARRAGSGGGIAADSTVDEGTGADWTVVVSKVLVLQEEGIFRAIVGSVPVKPQERNYFRTWTSSGVDRSVVYCGSRLLCGAEGGGECRVFVQNLVRLWGLV